MTGTKLYRFSYIFWGLAVLIFWPGLSFSKMKSNYPDIIYLSQDLLYAAKTGENTDSLEKTLKDIPQGEIINQLNSDEKKLSFYLNLYNALNAGGFLHIVSPAFVPLPRKLSSYFRFTDDFFKELCKRNDIKIEKIERLGFKRFPFAYYLMIKK